MVDLQVARDASTLVVMLTDERAEVRARAALALGSVQEPGSLDALAALLRNDPDPSVRRDAAFALGQLGDPATVEALAEALGDADPAVVDRSLEALGKIPSPAATTALLAADVGARHAARRALALSVNGAVHDVVSREAQDLLLTLLDDQDAQVRMGAAYYFGRTDATDRWGGRATRVRSVLDGYGRDDPAAMYLLQALGKLGAPDDTDRLITWASTAADWRARVEALNGFVRRPAPAEATERLLEILDHPIDHVAFLAGSALAQETQLPSTLGAVKTWLGANASRTVVAGPLLGLLARQNEREFVFEWVDGLAAGDVMGWSVGVNALALLSGAEALDRLVAAASTPSQAVQAEAVTALGDRWPSDSRNPSLVPIYFDAFTRALHEGNPEAAFVAAQRLTDPVLLDAGARPHLVRAYEDELDGGDPRQAAQFLRVVAMAAAPGYDQLLRDALDHPALVLRRTAASAIQTITGETVEVDLETEAPEARRGDVSLPYDPTVIDWGYLAGLGSAPRLAFDTDRGTVIVRMVPDEAPHTVQTMARLAEEGRFDGVPFHRVIPNFVVQGGDVDSGTGRGGPGYSITSEFNTLPYARGSIGMASAGKDTEGSQFFFAHTRLPHLDGGYTVFGWVVEGMDVVDSINRGDRIVSARLERD